MTSVDIRAARPDVFGRRRSRSDNPGAIAGALLEGAQAERGDPGMKEDVDEEVGADPDSVRVSRAGPIQCPAQVVFVHVTSVTNWLPSRPGKSSANAAT
jgi:hypothetical protein